MGLQTKIPSAIHHLHHHLHRPPFTPFYHIFVQDPRRIAPYLLLPWGSCTHLPYKPIS